jgi:O-antigen/teichoic acid export membrane protein
MIALHPESVKSIFKKGFWIQLVFSLPIALVIAGFSAVIAELFNDHHLYLPLKICGVIVMVQGMFFVTMGTMNGQKRFFSESLVIGIYSVIRPAAVLLLIWQGFGVVGAVGGYLFASASAALAGMMMIFGAPDRPITLNTGDLLQPALLNIVIFGSIAFLMNIDLLIVKNLLGDSRYSGFYTAASAISKPPCLLLFAFGSIALPLIARSYENEDIRQCKIYLSQIIRYSMLIFMPVIALVAVTSSEVVVLFYSSEYAPAGTSLRILIVGLWFVGNVYILSHVMIAIGCERLMAIFSVGAIALDLVLNLLFVSRFGITGAAFATFFSSFLLMLVCAFYVTKRIGIKISFATIFRLSFLILVISFIAAIFNSHNIPLLLGYIVLYAVYIVGLFLTGEFNAEDWTILKRFITQTVQYKRHHLRRQNG